MIPRKEVSMNELDEGYLVNNPKLRPVEEAEMVTFESLTRPKTNDG